MRAFRPDLVPRPDVTDPWSDGDPFDLEIGAGAGLFAIQYAKAHPGRRLLAIERTADKFARLEGRARHHDLPNLRVLRADAAAYVAHFVTTTRLARVFLLYPNPYPKAKHANLRWHNSPFLAHLGAKMAPGAKLHLATNLAWYATEAREKLAEGRDFELVSATTVDVRQSARTHFEKKYLARGETCFDLVFRRT